MLSAFQSVSVILPVMDETISLTKTVETTLQLSATDITELIIVVCHRTSKHSLATIELLQQRFGELIVLHHQKLPFVGGAIREGFDLARGSHVILMASDLETNPLAVPELIAQSKHNPDAIITTSRWLQGSNFSGYSKIKLIANWLFQRLFSLLYNSQLTDMTFAYRLFPTKVLRSIKWQELGHPFFFETIVKPIRLGIEIIEIPTTWTARTEGQSHNNFLRNFAYFKTGFQVRFAPLGSFLINPADTQLVSPKSADN
jgi:glycosyltransferase involved in cell wall biosynthesis